MFTSIFLNPLLEEALRQSAVQLQKTPPPEEFVPKQKVIILAGPTGCGKSDFAMKLAKELDGEILSADSMQVYRGMDIGTAKPTLSERAEIPHHLIDIRDVSNPMNVVDFFQAATSCLKDFKGRKEIPIVVGGSGFYLHSLLYGPPSGPTPNPQLRKEIEDKLEVLGADALYAQLEQLDVEYAHTITRHDRHKIVRALEIIHSTGKKVSAFDWRQRKVMLPYDFRCWLLHRPRHRLYHRIDKRCEKMLHEGLLDEVTRLKEEGLLLNNSAAQAIGYRQALDYLSSSQTRSQYAKFVEDFQRATRHYAKRQGTWFRGESHLWDLLDVETLDEETARAKVICDIRRDRCR